MYSVIILCKACIFYSLLVQFMKMQKTKPNMFLRETIKLGRDISWKLLVKAQNISTICEYLQKYLDVLPSMVTDILKQNVMCTVSFVQFASFSSNVWVFCLKSKILKASSNVDLDSNYKKYSLWVHVQYLLINLTISESLSSILISKHFTFLWGPLAMLPITDCALVLILQCKVQLYNAMHVYFTVWLLVNI